MLFPKLPGSAQNPCSQVKRSLCPGLLGLRSLLCCLPLIFETRLPSHAKPGSGGWLDDGILATRRLDPVAVEDLPRPDLRIHERCGSCCSHSNLPPLIKSVTPQLLVAIANLKSSNYNMHVK